MTDDIVTRLRACWCDTDYSSRGRVDPYCDHDGVRSDAADEFERLRADRDNWKDLASEYYHLDPKCECPLCDRFREAMGNG